MSTTHPTVDQVQAFIAAVKDRLVGVPDDERAELLDDVAAHVREVADEFGADQLTERLGTPEQFSDELRASAGYAPTDDAVTSEAKAPGPVRRLWAKANDRIRTDANRELWRKLEPGWFVVRGVLFGYFILSLTGADAAVLPKLGNNHLLGIGVLIAGAVTSFKLAERRPATETVRKRRARLAGEVALVVFGLAFLSDASNERVVFYDSGAGQYERDPCLRDAGGRAISNLFAFDTAGKLIPQFFLTDDKGRPIDNLCPDQQSGGEVKTSYARDVNGSQVYNVFPREQQRMTPDALGGINLVPVTPPAVLFPQLAPPVADAPVEQPEAAPSP